MATQAEIETSYDVGNDFFALWLDEKMNYSCALWDGARTLEQAQDAKLDFLHDLARIGPAHRVLDVGCGWGANLERLSRHRGVAAAHGITMSRAQHAEVTARGLPNVTVDVVDYREFVPAYRFDAAVSICMFEHIATPEQARRGEHMLVFHDYFRRLHAWTVPGAWFALQTIVINRLPRERRHIHDMAVATRRILPGSKCARLDEVVQSCADRWEVMEVHTRRDDYVRTCAEWLRRLRAHEDRIRERWGDAVYADYEHYLAGCVEAFAAGYLSLAQLALRRIDD